jgi:hypothetical protein
MDSTVLIAAFLASMVVVGFLAHERGRDRWRWVLIASIVGPFAIPLLYLVAGASALGKMIAPKRWERQA